MVRSVPLLPIRKSGDPSGSQHPLLAVFDPVSGTVLLLDAVCQSRVLVRECGFPLVHQSPSGLGATVMLVGGEHPQERIRAGRCVAHGVDCT